MSVDVARWAATTAVVRLHQGGWANLTAKTILANPALSPRDRSFAAAVFYGTAERLVTLDAILAPLSKRKLDKLDIEVRAILETGLYQMRYMNVPPSAAVNQAVQLVPRFGKTSAAGFVNAVLRKAAVAKLPDAFGSETERVSVTWSVSPAVADALRTSLPGEYQEFLQACFSNPELCLRANTLKTTVPQLVDVLRKQGGSVGAGQLSGSLYLKLPGGVANEEYFEKGYYHVQGEASQYACLCVGAAPGMRVLDLCAAPGGKTATLAQQMGGGQGLTACELRDNRMPLLEQTLGRLGIQGVALRQNDATVYCPELTGQQRILCDVPCSGLGVLAKKPDLRYLDGSNFDSLPQLQLQILKTAARYLERGGRLVYSTCTIRPEENASVVEAFLEQHPEFCLVEPPKPPKGAAIHNKMVTILPNRTGLDGFFVATLESL